MNTPCLIHLLLFIVSPIISSAAVWNVGPSYDYMTPNAFYLADVAGDIDIADFDTIYIESADYLGTDALAAWQQDNLFIQGEGDIDARPHMIADGAYILGKGTWVCVGNNITVSNIEFSGAAVPDENGAGIRLDGIGLTLLKCYFHHNENGLLTSNPYDGDIFIQFCEFAYNGFGDGFTHNMYIGHVNNFTLSHCYSHHTNVGHNVKSRANNNFIIYNRITDESDGNSSRLIDLSNGGYALVKGNALMQGPAALNNNAVGYGLEGLTNPAPHEFYFVHNTMVNKREASCRFLQIADGTMEAYIVNNIFAGTGDLLEGEATTFSHNYADEDISVFDFEAEEVYVYNIGLYSVAKDSGMILTGDLEATSQYYHNTYLAGIRDLHGIRPDIGAYEYHDPIGYKEFEKNIFSIYPNPSKGLLHLHLNQNFNENILIQILDHSGQLIYSNSSTLKHHTIDLSNYARGSVIVKVITQNSTHQEIVILN